MGNNSNIDTLWGVFDEEPEPKIENPDDPAKEPDPEEELDSYFGPALQEFLAQAERTGWDPTASLPSHETTGIFVLPPRRESATAPISMGPTMDEILIQGFLRENPFFQTLSPEGITILQLHSEISGSGSNALIHSPEEENPQCLMTTKDARLFAFTGTEPPQTLNLKEFELIDPFILIGEAPTRKIRTSAPTPYISIDPAAFEKLSTDDQIEILKKIITAEDTLSQLNHRIQKELGGELGTPIPRLKMTLPNQMYVDPNTIHRTTYKEGERILFAPGKFVLIPSGAVNVTQDEKMVAVIWGPNILFEQAAITGKFPAGIEIHARTPEVQAVYVGTDPHPQHPEKQVDIFKVLAKSRRDKIHKASQFYAQLIMAMMAKNATR
jgi:hypothetical protein